MIDVSRPFFLYAECSIIYDGRAYSTLDQGRYLVIYKADGSLLIHGADLCKPRNYQQAGSKISFEDGILTSVNKKEKIIISVAKIVDYSPLDDWSDSKIKISRTEKDLVNKIFDNWVDYFEEDFYLIQEEYRTEHGPIDILGISESGVYHVIEVKRKKGTISNGTQLKRYVDVLRDEGKEVRGYLACPEIGDNALKYLHKHEFEWLKITFDQPAPEANTQNNSRSAESVQD